jgi:hypothetical protein
MDEAYRFFAIVVHMSLVKKPSIRDYFSSNSAVYSTVPLVAGMSGNRFRQILLYIHVSDNLTADQSDNLRKVRT